MSSRRLTPRAVRRPPYFSRRCRRARRNSFMRREASRRHRFAISPPAYAEAGPMGWQRSARSTASRAYGVDGDCVHSVGTIGGPAAESGLASRRRRARGHGYIAPDVPGPYSRGADISPHRPAMIGLVSGRRLMPDERTQCYDTVDSHALAARRRYADATYATARVKHIGTPTTITALAATHVYLPP